MYNPDAVGTFGENAKRWFKNEIITKITNGYIQYFAVKVIFPLFGKPVS